MKQASENQTGRPGEHEQEYPAGWHAAKPETIPSPTYWPFVLSVGATLVGLGILTSDIITVTGTVLFLLGIIKWIGELCSEDRQ